MALTVPADLDLPTIRQRLAAHDAQLLPLGSALQPHHHPRGESGGVLDKRAAVACILRDGEQGPEVMLIKRAEHPSDPWSGHMAFPGGREDPGDEDLRHTALRETREEVGLDLRSHGEPIGRLDDLPAIARSRPTGLLIAPFVYQLEVEPSLRPNEEVQEVVWGPLWAMASGRLDTTRSYQMEGQTWKLPAYNVDGRIVWGLTYQMLQRLFSLVLPRR